MMELNQISRKLVGEGLELVLEKAYCTILFTSNYVIKLFSRNKREYDAQAIRYEYLWDKSMPFLCAKFEDNIELNNSDISALILKRIPYSSNMLYRLVNNNISKEEIVEWVYLVRKLMSRLPKIDTISEELYRNYILNLELQISKLNDKVNPELLHQLEEIENNGNVMDLFEKIGKKEKAVLVHGNLFSGNVFFYKEELIVIDPISYNHIARKSFSWMDLATFLVDIRIFKDESDYLYVYQKIILNMQDYEILVLKLYFILKLLVRIRFAYLENGLKDEYSKVNVNEIIITNSEKILKSEIKNILYELKKFFADTIP